MAQSLPTDFGATEVKDARNDWRALANAKLNHNGINATDITSVRYYSVRGILYAELWFPSLIELSSKEGYPSVNTIVYGMLLDSDLKDTTGYQGVDHQIEVKWNGTSRAWIKQVNLINIDGDPSNISTTTNYQGFLKGKIIRLDINLSDINTDSIPNKKYRMFLYAYNSGRNEHAPWTIDFMRWIFIPPPEFTLSAHDDSVRTTQHGNINNEVYITTAYPRQAQVVFEPDTSNKMVSVSYDPPSLNMSSVKEKSTMILQTNSPDLRNVTVQLKARVSFPTQYFDNVLLAKGAQGASYPIESEEIFAVPDPDFNDGITLELSKDAQLLDTITDALSGFWIKLGGILTAVATASVVIFRRIRKPTNDVEGSGRRKLPSLRRRKKNVGESTRQKLPSLRRRKKNVGESTRRKLPSLRRRKKNVEEIQRHEEEILRHEEEMQQHEEEILRHEEEMQRHEEEMQQDKEEKERGENRGN